MASDQQGPSAERIAAAARALEPRAHEALALSADSVADDLAARLLMVAWEREQQIGDAQRTLLDLALNRRLPIERDAPPARVRELARQPLAALAPVWSALRRGRQVHLESEAGACPGAFRIARDWAEQLPRGALTVSSPGVLDHPAASWVSIGVEPSKPRIALVQADADSELAAYLIARGCLRRTGFDPRVVHHVIVVGAVARTLRNLRRLWVGARMGPVDDEDAFSGPVTAEQFEVFLAAQRAWQRAEGVSTICPGDRLLRADAPDVSFLAPALFRAPAFEGGALESNEPACCGPMLVLHPVADGPNADAHGEALLAQLSRDGQGHLRFGAKPRGLELRPIDGQIHGALLVERLPPGLPEPRP